MNKTMSTGERGGWQWVCCHPTCSAPWFRAQSAVS